MRLSLATGLNAIAHIVLGSISYIAAAQTLVRPQTMLQIGRVDPRFVSYNIEAVEVTGGRFWKPYRSNMAAPTAEGSNSNQPSEMNSSLFQYRSPIDLSKPRLRMLAAALAPAFVRVSGTWRNSTFFQDDDAPALATVPDGYKGVMTRAEWKGVIDFAQAVDADIVTSVATSRGTRDADGVWTSTQAEALINYTQSVGGKVAAIEFMNEPTFAMIGGAPAGYNAQAFAKDLKVFVPFLRKQSPQTIFLGTGSVGEGAPMIEGAPTPKMINTVDMLKATGPIFDAFSYHFYGTVSKRCAAPLGPKAGMSPEKGLSEEWLAKNVTVEEFYSKLRNEFLPGKPMWLTETGEAACGGDPWASKFLDSFRYVDQLGTLAQKSVQTVIVNTLASSDYGLLNEDTLEPRPNYWAALFWKRTMGEQVLAPGPTPNPKMRMYAQCMKNSIGGVAMVMLNLDRDKEQILKLPLSGERFTLSAADVLSEKVSMNGVQLDTAADGSLPAMAGKSFKSGNVSFAPLTITFITFPKAHNASCGR